MTQAQIDQVDKILPTVRGMLNLLGADEAAVAEAQEVVGEIGSEIKSQSPEPSKVNTLAFKLTELAATGTVQAAVGAVTAVIQQGVAGIG